MIKKTHDILLWLKKFNQNHNNCQYHIIPINSLDSVFQKHYLSQGFSLDDHVVNYIGDVFLDSLNLDTLPIQFHEATGWFTVERNHLKNLKGCPQIMNSLNNVHAEIRYSYNPLVSLEGMPQILDASVKLFSCQLKNLKYCSHTINGDFVCSSNQLNTLEYFPHHIYGYVYLRHNMELLKYNLFSEKNFLDNNEFDFWFNYHLKDKISNDNKIILNQLSLIDERENKIKKI